MSSLLHLPDELIVHILAIFAGQKTDVLNFAKTCHHAYDLAECFLFRSILVRRAGDARTLRLLLDSNPKRPAYVQDVAIVPFVDERNDDIRTLSTTLARLTKVEHLHIESPYLPPVPVGSEEPVFWAEFRSSFDQLGVQAGSRLRLPFWAWKLKSCYLNFQLPQGQMYDMPAVASVFAAPCITNITIVDADLRNFRCSTFNIRRRTSPLEVIDLQSCAVDPESTFELLSIPRALIKFSFSAHWLADEATDDSETEEFDRLRNLISTLSVHRRSLTDLRLTIGCDEILGIEEKAQLLPLNGLSSLQRLEFRWYDQDDCGVNAILSHLPPSVTHLKIGEESRGGWPEALHAAAVALRDNKSMVPNLQQLEVEWSPHAAEVSGDLQERFGFAGVGLKTQRNVQFHVLRRTEQRGAVPPYLWDEYVPEVVLVHDNFSIERLWETKTADELQAEEEKRVAEAEAKARAEESSDKDQEAGPPLPLIPLPPSSASPSPLVAVI